LHDANNEQGSALAIKDQLVGQISFGPSKMGETAMEKQVLRKKRKSSNIIALYMFLF
jgi:hypothetical protein